MSQIFDSLKHGRKPPARQTSGRTAQRDVVLATLGYMPPRHVRRYGVVAVSAAIAATIAVIGWLGWRTYLGDRDESIPSRPTSPLLAVQPVFASPPAHTPSETDRVSRSRREADATPSATTSATPSLSPQPSAAPSAADSQPVAPASSVQSAQDRQEPSQEATESDRAVGRTPDSPSRTPATGAIAPPNDLVIALYFHRAGEFENALRYYRMVLERDELNAQAHNNLGLLYQERGRLQDSARELKRALAIEPRNAGTRNNYGVTLLMLKRIDEAAAEFRAALALEPGNLDALVNLGLAQRDAGQLDAAKETLLRALNLAPDNAAAHYNLAQLYDQTHEPARAVEHYRRFLEHAGVEHADRGAAVRARIAALSR